MDGPREIDLRDDRAAAPNCRSAAGRRFEARLVGHLRSSGYPARRSRPGEDQVAVPYDPLNPGHVADAGRHLARYHGAVRSFPHRFRAAGRPALPSLEHAGPYLLAAFTDAAGAFLSPADRARLTQACSFLWSQFIRVPEALVDLVPGLPQLVIHGAYDASALICHGDRITGVTGWQHAAYELRLLDLGSAIGALAPSAGRPVAGFDVERGAALVAAYREVEPIPDAELAALPLVFRAHRLMQVLGGVTRFLHGRGAAPQPEADARHLVDVVEWEAAVARWLESEEHDVVSALARSPVV